MAKITHHCSLGSFPLHGHSVLRLWTGKAITSIPLTFSWDTAPKGGGTGRQCICSIQQRGEFKVEGAGTTKGMTSGTMARRPIVEVELSAKDGYYFSSTKRSIFSLTGCWSPV